MRVTETTIQNALYHFLRQRGVWPILPNIDCVTGYEADILTITKSGYAHEYEIKLTLSDFRADLKKRHKHASFSGEFKTVPNPFYKSQFPDRYPETIDVLKDSVASTAWAILSDQCHPGRKPKRFWYVVHGFDVPTADIPSYAGLMKYIPKAHWSCAFDVVKKAPDLDAKPANEQHIRHAAENMLFRYWALRTKERQEAEVEHEETERIIQ